MLNKLEYELLKEFSKSLTSRERLLVQAYLQQLPPETDRIKKNLMAITWMEGYRFAKRERT